MAEPYRTPSKETAVVVHGVSKKFCSSLRRSMSYGTLDLAKNLIGLRPKTDVLRRQEFWALDDISFELPRGCALGLIGTNGSGKTTLLRLLAGIFPPDRGEIAIRGRIGALIALGAGFHPHMTGLENIYLNGTILGLSKAKIRSRVDAIVDFADIGSFINAPVSTYSSGMRIRLGFSIAIQCEPDVLLVDEILAVGDLGFRAKCYGTIQSLRDSGSSIIVVSHNTTQLLKVVDQMMVLEKGHVVFHGDNHHAIALYEETIHRTKSKSVDDTTNAIVRVEACTFRNADGAETCEFRTSDDIMLEFHYDSEQDFMDVTWLVAIHSVALGSIASFTNHAAGHRVDIGKGRGCVRLRLGRVPLLAGAFEIVTHVYNGPESIVGFGMKPFTFRIVAPPTDPYRECRVVHFDSTWVGGTS